MIQRDGLIKRAIPGSGPTRTEIFSAFQHPNNGDYTLDGLLPTTQKDGLLPTTQKSFQRASLKNIRTLNTWNNSYLFCFCFLIFFDEITSLSIFKNGVMFCFGKSPRSLLTAPSFWPSEPHFNLLYTFSLFPSLTLSRIYSVFVIFFAKEGECGLR